MTSLDDILPVSHIILDAEISSKKRLFECVAQLFAEQSGLSQTEVFDCLIARERLGSTALGQGVAMPHGRHAGVPAATGAFVRLKEPIEFDAPDNKHVSLVFVLLVPEAATGEHLALLSHLAGLFNEKSVREALRSCQTPEEARALLLA